MWPPASKAAALILTTCPMESASATALPPPMPIPQAESASPAHPTASPASPTPSAMPAMLASTSPTESASPPQSPAPADSSGTMESATPPAQLEAAHRVTSARECAPQDRGLTRMDAIEIAPPSTPPMTPVLTPAQLEQPFRMESAWSDLRAAPAASSETARLAHAPTVNTHALSALSLPLSAQLALLA